MKVKAHELRNKKKDELLKQLDELRNELAQVRFLHMLCSAVSPRHILTLLSPVSLLAATAAAAAAGVFVCRGARVVQHRVAKQTGGAASKVAKIKVLRKSIARVLTVYNQSARSEIREMTRKYKYMPTDLRYKKTRAMRRKLSVSEKNVKSLRATKRAQNFPLRKYAVKA